MKRFLAFAKNVLWPASYIPLPVVALSTVTEVLSNNLDVVEFIGGYLILFFVFMAMGSAIYYEHGDRLSFTLLYKTICQDWTWGGRC